MEFSAVKNYLMDASFTEQRLLLGVRKNSLPMHVMKLNERSKRRIDNWILKMSPEF